MDPSNNQEPNQPVLPPVQPQPPVVDPRLEQMHEQPQPPVQPLEPVPDQPQQQVPGQTDQMPQEPQPQTQPLESDPMQEQPLDQEQPGDDEQPTYALPEKPRVIRDPISWQASESVHHSKNASWYMGLIIAGVLMILVAIFLLKLWSFAVLIVIMVGSLIYLSMHPPRQFQYQLTDSGLSVNEKQYTFADFKSFSVIQDGSFDYLRIIHVKKFMPPIDVYFPPERGDEIVEILGDYIPFKVKTPDVIDRLTKRLRL